MIGQGKLRPDQLIQRTIALEESIEALPRMNHFEERGVTIIDRF